ncbi:MAG: hypothetical protein ACR2QV_01590 [Gammaproteobacteria bacterium]
MYEYGNGIGGNNNVSWSLYDAVTGNSNGTTMAGQGHPGAWSSILLSDYTITHAVSPGFSGTLGLLSTTDNDQIGLVFGYQDPEHLYLFQWKKGGSTTCCSAPASKGMHIRRIAVPPGGTLNEDDLEGHFDTPNSVILAENNTEWFANTTYDYSVTFLPTGFRFVVTDGGTVLADWVINDTVYSSGKIGFYNSSQNNCRYTTYEVPNDLRMELVQVERGAPAGTVTATPAGYTRGFYNVDSQIVAMDPGPLTLQYDIDPNPGNELFDHVLSDVVWDLDAGTVGVSGFDCAEGTQGAGISEFLCAGTEYGVNAVNESTTDYSVVPGTRVVGGDDSAIGPQQQADDYTALQTSWDGSTLVAETAAWTASPGLAGYRLTFAVLAPNPQPVGLALARLGTPAGVEEAAPAGLVSATYDTGLDTVTMDTGTLSLPYFTGGPSGTLTFEHVLNNAAWDLATGSMSYSNFDCVEGVHGATIGRFLCANSDYGSNLINETTTDYVAEPGTRVIGGDDVALGPQLQGGDYAANEISWDGTTLTIESPDWTANPDGSGGATAGYQLIFVSGSPPDVTIGSPQPGMISSESLPLNLAATAVDPEEGDISGQITWSSDIDGVLTMPAQLSVGAHVITASATDSSGLTGFGTAAVTVFNGPTVSISAPTNGTAFVDGAAITLAGTALDVEDGDISGSIQWTSDLDGALGSGPSLPVSLSLGAHLITATVVDSNGHSPLVAPTSLVIVQQDSDTDGLPDVWEATFGVSDPGADDDGDTVTNAQEYSGGTNPVDAAPQVTILSPASGYAAGPGEAVNFMATAADNEDGDVSAGVRWVSDLDGELGTGATLPVALSIGTHTITATVTDSAGGIPALAPTVQVIVSVRMIGDLDDDGDIDISDLLLLQQLLLGT